MVDYVIDIGDTPEFLRLMARRRAIRRRDGARNWALLRDLENPRHWSESYHIAPICADDLEVLCNVTDTVPDPEPHVTEVTARARDLIVKARTEDT